LIGAEEVHARLAHGFAALAAGGDLCQARHGRELEALQKQAPMHRGERSDTFEAGSMLGPGQPVGKFDQRAAGLRREVGGSPIRGGESLQQRAVEIAFASSIRNHCGSSPECNAQ